MKQMVVLFSLTLLLVACSNPVPEATPSSAAVQPPLGLLDNSSAKIAYVGSDGNVWVINPDGSEHKRLTSDGAAAEPAWSPDRMQIAYIHTVGTDQVGSPITEIVAMTANGSDFRVVKPSERAFPKLYPDSYAVYRNPRWAIDGSGVFYHDNRGGPNWNHIRFVSVRQDGADEFSIWAYPGFDISPADGSFVYTVYSNATPGVGYGLMAENKDGSNRRFAKGIDPEWAYKSPAYSPDGKRIAFFASQLGSDTGMIVLMDADGNNLHDLASYTETRGDPTVDWSPDGRQLVYESRGAIWVIRVDGAEAPRRLVEGHTPAW